MWLKLLQGAFIGMSLVLPGMSGGTALIILGLYRQFLDDISMFRIKRHLILALGVALGVLVCAFILTELLGQSPDYLVSFLLGMLLASIKLLLAPLKKEQIRIYYLLFTLAGFLIAWTVVGDPIGQVSDASLQSPFLFLGGGILTSATMLIPGLSGSSILIMLNLYEDLLQAVAGFSIWPNLILFSLGLVTGIILFARLISSLYNKYQAPVSFFLSGLLLGSTKALFPSFIDPLIILLVIAGFSTVLLINYRKGKGQEQP